MMEPTWPNKKKRLLSEPALRQKSDTAQTRDMPPASRLTRFLVLSLAVVILACLNKLILGTGQNFSAGQMMVQSTADIYFARVSSFSILLLSILLAGVTGISQAALKSISIFWLPLIGYLWLRVPIFDGDGAVLLRTLNFYAVLASMSILASNRKNAELFLLNLYYLIAFVNLIGLTLFIAKVEFSYFSDGYGIMFTGLFPQKDLLSTTAALGACLALFRLLTRYKFIDIGIFILQITTLFLSSTLSSLGAFIFGALAIFAPVFAIGFAGSVALCLPVMHSVFAPVAILFGKDPSFTGRTRLWDFTLQEAQQAPLFGHGFRHISATAEWMQMVQSEFRSDSFFIPHAHNLWVEGYDKFGIFGIILLALALIVSPMLFKRPQNGEPLDQICYALLPFWLFKSALTVPFLNSDTTAYLWAFCLSFCVAWLKHPSLKQNL